MSDFKRQPLTDPSNQIRLLQLPATRWAGGMHLQLSTWDLEKAPPYSAISYTWGPAGYPTRSVTINDQNMEVRQKCRFALLQARTRCPGEYVWIDSICINQDDLSEMSLQVAIMFDIYRGAKQVLACIGESSESSRRLAPVANIIGHMRIKHDLFKDLVTIPEAPGALMSLPLITILRGLGKETMLQLNQDLIAMSERGYWHRLWIVQEIAAGQAKVRILCGTDMISPIGLYLLTRHLDGPGYYRDPSSRLFDQIVTSTAYTRLSARSLDDIFIDYVDARCSDARDKIYGVLGLVDWKRYGLKPLMPDYTTSIWKLALQLIKYTRSIRLLWAFNISVETPELQELVHSRSLLLQDVRPSSTLLQQGYCLHDKLVHARNLVANIDLNSSKHLSLTAIDIAIDSRPNPGRKRAQNGTMNAWEAMCEEKSVSADILPKPVYVKQGIAALACAATLPGDYMINAGYEDVYLIVRHSEKVACKYDVVGQALVVNGYRLARETHPAWLSDPKLKSFVNDTGSASRCSCTDVPSQPAESFWADTKIRWTPEDAMLLAGQDLLPNREMRDVNGKFARLTTRTLIDPNGAIKVDRLVDTCAQCKRLRSFPA